VTLRFKATGKPFIQYYHAIIILHGSQSSMLLGPNDFSHLTIHMPTI